MNFELRHTVNSFRVDFFLQKKRITGLKELRLADSARISPVGRNSP